MAVERVKSVRRAKARPRYETSTGEFVPGVTTILSLKAKPALVEWAFRIGKENPELPSIRAYVDDLADIGTVVHALIGGHLLETPPDLSDYSPNVVRAAEVPFAKFIEWTKGRKIEVLGSELSLVSDEFRFGGTIDLLARIDGFVTVLDAKSGKAIYDEYLLQTRAYAKLVEERMSLRPDRLHILQIGRVGAEGFAERIVASDDPRYALYWDAFKALRDLYQTERDLEWANKQDKASVVGDASNVIHIGDYVPKARPEVLTT